MGNVCAWPFIVKSYRMKPTEPRGYISLNIIYASVSLCMSNIWGQKYLTIFMVKFWAVKNVMVLKFLSQTFNEAVVQTTIHIMIIASVTLILLVPSVVWINFLKASKRLLKFAQWWFVLTYVVGSGSKK